MNLTLYTVSRDNKYCDKISTATIITETAKALDPIHDVDIISPTFVIARDNTYISANYCYSDTFGRYYYINNISLMTGNRMKLECTIDVRQTYHAAIKNCRATIIRAEKPVFPTLFTDNQIPVNQSRKQIKSIVLRETSNTFDTDAQYSYLLTVVGGDTSGN